MTSCPCASLRSRPRLGSLTVLSLLKDLSLLPLLWLPVKRRVAPSTTGTRRCTTASCPCAAATSAAPYTRAGLAQVGGGGPGGCGWARVGEGRAQVSEGWAQVGLQPPHKLGSRKAVMA